MIIAAQLYICNKMPDLDAQIGGLLHGLREAGYEAIEAMAGKAPHNNESLQTANIAYAATHLTPPALEPLEPLIEFLNGVDARHVCTSGPLQWNARAPNDYRQTAAFLNAKGRQLREHGVHLHYHNHAFEFERVAGEQTAMDLLLAALDPTAVTLCFDAGWAERAGQSAAAFMTEYGDRIRFLHLRDFSGAQSVPLGRGDIDLAAQIALLPHLLNLEYLVVEQDPAPDPLADMQASRRYLREIFAL